jgi:hypothetical protein
VADRHGSPALILAAGAVAWPGDLIRGRVRKGDIMIAAAPAAALILALSAGIAGPSPAATAGQALPARYHYQTVALPGYSSLDVNGISDSGAYTGEACKDRNCTKPALFVATAAGKVTFYTLPFANYSETGPFNAGPSAMDNAGDVDGYYLDSTGSFHGYLRTASGVLTQIDDPLAADISDGGTLPENISPDGSVIVGDYADSAGVLHGFLLRGGTYTTYDVPGAMATIVTFDTDGEFGGDYEAASGAMLGFYVINGGLHSVSAPAEQGAQEPGVSLSNVDSGGTVFGYAFSANLPAYGFAYANGLYTTFRDPNQAGTSPEAGTYITNANSNGVVVGEYSYTNGTATQYPYTEGFIARPDGS